MQYKKNHIQTNDGSWTYRIEGLKESYHSRHGAVTESQFVYVDAGLSHWIQNNPSSSCRILELGYGTGLMAYLSFIAAVIQKKAIHYTSLEPYPINLEELHLLEYQKFFVSKNCVPNFNEFSALPWEQANKISPFFTLTKKKIRFEDFKESSPFDVIYYDAFGAHAQPELWEPQRMQKCYDLLAPNGVWVSYCAKGSVRRAMAAAGFEVARLAGPPGKREMLRGVKA